MWHNVGLTLLVFVATLLIVLLLMVCGEWGIRRGAVARCGTHASSTRVADLLVLSGLKKIKAWMGKCLKIICCPTISQE